MPRHFTLISLSILALFGGGIAAAADSDTPVAITGTVTALKPEHKAFVLKGDGGDAAVEYRAYFRDPKHDAVLAQIAKLTIGEHVSLTYVEHEGRRILTLTEVAAK